MGSMFCFQKFVGHRCHKTLRTAFPQRGGVCNIPGLNFHVIKVNKGKIRPRSWDTYSRLNFGQSTIVGITFGLLMPMEIGRGNGKGKDALIRI